MSGHSKWATIRHKKAAIDKVRGKTFAKLARLLEVASRAGGGDVATNASLRTVVAKAKAASMTNDAIERAIKRGMGETDGKAYESVTYEAYAPGGVAMLIDILTDNRNRTAADVRIIFSKQGGSMAAPGSVAWQFSRKGVILVPKSASEEELMTIGLDHGLEDITAEEEMWHVTCDPSQVYELKAALESAKISVSSATSTMLSANTVTINDPDEAKAILKIMNELDDNDDVQDVYANFDISESLMQEVG